MAIENVYIFLPAAAAVGTYVQYKVSWHYLYISFGKYEPVDEHFIDFGYYLVESVDCLCVYARVKSKIVQFWDDIGQCTLRDITSHIVRTTVVQYSIAESCSGHVYASEKYEACIDYNGIYYYILRRW